MIAIPNMEKPEYCRVCHERLKCKQYDGEILHTPDDCPLIDIVTCGECKWCDNKGKERALICTNPYIDMDIHPLDFCSYGERKSDDNLR